MIIKILFFAFLVNITACSNGSKNLDNGFCPTARTSDGVCIGSQNQSSGNDEESLTAKVRSKTDIKLAWTDSGTTQIAYQIGTTAPVSCAAGTPVIGVTGQSHTVTGLSLGSTYSFRVCISGIDDQTITKKLQIKNFGGTIIDGVAHGNYFIGTPMLGNSVSIYDYTGGVIGELVSSYKLTTSNIITGVKLRKDGNFLYIPLGSLGGSPNAHIEVLNITDPLNITTESTLAIPGNSQSCMITDGAITIDGTRLYLACTNSFDIIDISNPAAPIQLGGYHAGELGGTAIGGIAISGNYAFVGSDTGLHAVDVSNPASLSIDASDNDGGALEPKYSGVAAVGTTIYSGSENGDLFIYTANLATGALTKVGTFGIGKTYYHLIIEGNYLYASTKEGVLNIDKGSLEIFDISNPTSPISVASVNDGSMSLQLLSPGKVLIVGGDSMTIADLTNPTIPNVIQEIEVVGFYSPELKIKGTNIFINSLGIISVIDYEDLANAKIVQRIRPTGTSLYAFFDITGDHLVAGKNDGDVHIFSIASNGRLTQTGSISLTGDSVQSLTVEGDYAYVVVDTGNSVRVLDISNKSAPVLLGSEAGVAAASLLFADIVVAGGNIITTAGPGNGVNSVTHNNTPFSLVNNGTSNLGGGGLSITALNYDGTNVFASDQAAGLVIFDPTNLTTRLSTTAVTMPTVMMPVMVCASAPGAGDHAAIFGFMSGVEIFDVSNPSSPLSTDSQATPPNYGGNCSISEDGNFVLSVSLYGSFNTVDISDDTSIVVYGDPHLYLE